MTNSSQFSESLLHHKINQYIENKNCLISYTNICNLRVIDREKELTLPIPLIKIKIKIHTI